MKFNITGLKIEFDSNFNEPLDEYYLDEIKKCKIVFFGKRFDQSVDNLPNNVRQIYFGSNFDQPVDNLTKRNNDNRF